MTRSQAVTVHHPHDVSFTHDFQTDDMDRTTLEAWATWAFSPSLSAILITLFISLVSPLLVHYYLYRKAVSKELPSFLLLGPSGAGKTSLLTLVNSHPPPQ